MLHPEGATLLAQLIFDAIKDVNADCVGGLEMGAVPLIAPVAMRSLEAGQPLMGFFVRKAPKDHGTRQRIEGIDMAGKTAVIVEDVTTTGGSAMQAVEEVREGRRQGGAGGIYPRSRRRRARALRRRRRPVHVAVHGQEFLRD